MALPQRTASIRHKLMLVARWCGRIGSLLVILSGATLALFMATGVEPPRPVNVELPILLPVYLLALVVGWWKEGLAGLLGMVAVLTFGPSLLSALAAVPVGFFLLAWFLDHGER